MFQQPLRRIWLFGGIGKPSVMVFSLNTIGIMRIVSQWSAWSKPDLLLA